MPNGERGRHQVRGRVDRDDTHACCVRYFAAAFWRLKWPRPGR
jgi:hypothetical protein